MTNIINIDILNKNVTYLKITKSIIPITENRKLVCQLVQREIKYNTILYLLMQ